MRWQSNNNVFFFYVGNWAAAAQDLRQACKLDYDEEADDWLREVTPNAKKIEAHNVKRERRNAEREEKQRRERVRQAQEANKKAREEAAAAGDGDDDFMGGVGGGADFLNAFKDPEVAAALQDILQNPSNISKYMGNPKIMALLSKISAGGGGFPFGGMGGMGAGFPGAFPGADGAEFDPTAPTSQPDAPKTTPKSDLHDDGLD